MCKHEINYHEKIDIIEFIFEFCTHSRKIKTDLMKINLTNKEKKISFEKKSFLNQSEHVKFDTLIVRHIEIQLSI